MKEQKITRIPLKFRELFCTIWNESVWKIFKNILGWNENLNDTENIYFDLIMNDINEINKKAGDWNKGWRPKKKPKVIEKENLRLEKSSQNLEPSKDKISKDKISKEKIEKEKTDFIDSIKEYFEGNKKYREYRLTIYPKQLREEFIDYWTEPFVTWRNKWRCRFVWQKTWDTWRRFDTFLKNYLRNDWITVRQRKIKHKNLILDD